jgi:fatty acid/phospholipid biosynthesis enzyme
MKIALDVMGGDHAPRNPMGGVKLALEELTQIEKIYLVGVPEVIEREMQQQGIPQSPKLEIVPAYQVVDMTDSGLDAVRKKKDSSISRAVDLVKDRLADAVVSAGHTGAAVTASLIKLRTLPKIDTVVSDTSPAMSARTSKPTATSSSRVTASITPRRSEKMALAVDTAALNTVFEADKAALAPTRRVCREAGTAPVGRA